MRKRDLLKRIEQLEARLGAAEAEIAGLKWSQPVYIPSIWPYHVPVQPWWHEPYITWTSKTDGGLKLTSDGTPDAMPSVAAPEHFGIVGSRWGLND